MTIKNILYRAGKKLILLIDPENTTPGEAGHVSQSAEKSGFSFVLLGGSLVSVTLKQHIDAIHQASGLPVMLFPGSVYQIEPEADGILFLSLISGRNPEYLIGQHVVAAPLLKKSGMEIIPAGYILVGNGDPSAVEYMSNTRPIPAAKPELVAATAMAGEMLGLQAIYLEAGSGAASPVNPEIIQHVKNQISVPLILGGGIEGASRAKELFDAGAHALVIGNAIEKNPALIQEFGELLRSI